MKIEKSTQVIEVEGGMILGIPIKANSDTPKKDGLHQIYIVDRSGSMTWDLPQVVEDLKKVSKQLRKGDAVTFGWFSSEGMYSFPIKCFKISDNESRTQLNRLFDEQKRAKSLTCFSEILGELPTIVEETEFLGFKKSVMFFSDGYANDPGVSIEHERTKEVLLNVRDHVDYFMTVAYSDYSDKDFLEQMASVVGGRMVHNSEIEEFSGTIETFVKEGLSGAPKNQIDLSKLEFTLATDFGFTLNSKMKTISQFEVSNSIPYNPTENGKIYLFIAAKDPGDIENLEDGKQIPVDAELSLIYAAAGCALKRRQLGTAGNLMMTIGDKFFVDGIYNAFTPSEKGAMENFLSIATFNESARMLDGNYPGCKPKTDQFCLLDLLEVINEEEDVKIHTRHPSFKYKRIGRKSIYDENTPKFVPAANVTSSFGGFVWNKKFLNLSVRVKTDGYVTVPDSTKNKSGEEIERPDTLLPDVETFIWRTYNLVKDGYLHTSSLPVSGSEKFFNRCKEEGLIQDDFNSSFKWEGEDSVFVLNLRNIPLINRDIVSQGVEFDDFCQALYRETYTTLQLKVYNSIRKELDPDKKVINLATKFTEEERDFLIAVGFRDDGSYSPTMTREDPTDQYETTAFETKIHGFSSAPSLKALRDKLGKISLWDGKGRKPVLNGPSTIMAEELERFTNKTSGLHLDDQLLEVDGQIKALKWTLGKIRQKIQRPKFAMVLGGEFAEIKDWEVSTPQGPITMDFVSKTETVKI